MKYQAIFIFGCAVLFSHGVNAQKFEGGSFVTLTGRKVKVGDTLQLGKVTMGKHYQFISYKYVGVPSLMIKKRGPASGEYEGSVVFVEKIIANEGLVVVKGIPYYKFECKAIGAFKAGEIEFFSTK